MAERRTVPPYVPLATPGVMDLEYFQQVHFANWCSPGFWHRLLAPQRTPPLLDKLPGLPLHYGAGKPSTSGGIGAKVLTWQRALPNEMFLRAGGQQLRNELSQLQCTVEQMSATVDDN